MVVSGDWKVDVAIAAISLLIFAYIKIKKHYKCFEESNIPYIKPTFLVGSDPEGVLMKIHPAESWHKFYVQLENEKIVGFFQTLLPFLMIREPEYIDEILKSGFDHFFDRNFLVDVKRNPLDAHLFFLRGSKWRFMRNKLNPIFSSAKLKWMYEEIDKCGNVFMDYIDNIADGRDIDLKEQFARFSTDVIASCAFGLETDSLKNQNSDFRQAGKDFFDPKKNNMFFVLLQFSLPKLLIWFKIRTTSENLTNFFCSTTKNVLDHRRKTGIVRKDFVQLLLEIKDSGTAEKDPNYAKEEKESDKIEITDSLLAAQSFVFFVAGFETTSTTLHLLLYLLAMHPDKQEKARKEILEIKSKHGGLTYDSLKNMTYLENCISETLRLYPALPMINRECTKDYTLPNGTVIKKGTKIVIPIFSLQRDPKHFPEPLKFLPERFESAPARGTYAPFGDGPRVCIGKRFAFVEMKNIVARLLEKYRFGESPLNKAGHPVKINPGVIVIAPLNKLLIKVHKLSENK